MCLIMKKINYYNFFVCLFDCSGLKSNDLRMNRSVKTQGIKTTKLQSLAKEETFCKYTHRTCMQNCVDGYDYCIRHILEDKAAPFKQCTYMTKSGKRCPTAAPKHERKDG